MITYWQLADESDGHLQVFGIGTTAMIVDDSLGGVIAYCHKDNVDFFIAKGDKK
jgi:hypothetical protein